MNTLFRHKKILVFLLLFPMVLSALQRDISDYGVFINGTRAWLAGETELYDGKVAFYYAPWTIAAFLPLSFLPDRIGQLIYTTLSLGLLVWAASSFGQELPWWGLAFSLTNANTAFLIFTGQWDSFILASLALGWLVVQSKKKLFSPYIFGLALVGLSSKPTNIILPGALLLYTAFIEYKSVWKGVDWLKVLFFPVLIFFASLVVFGWDWPMRYIWFLKNYPNPSHYLLITPWGKTDYQVSYWMSLSSIGKYLLVFLAVGVFSRFIWVLKNKQTEYGLMLAIVLNLVITPYALVYHFVYLAAVGVWIFRKKVWAGTLVFCLGVVDLVFLFIGMGLFISPLGYLLIILIIDVRVSPAQLSKISKFNQEKTVEPGSSTVFNGYAGHQRRLGIYR